MAGRLAKAVRVPNASGRAELQPRGAAFLFGGTMPVRASSATPPTGSPAMTARTHTPASPSATAFRVAPTSIRADFPSPVRFYCSARPIQSASAVHTPVRPPRHPWPCGLGRWSADTTARDADRVVPPPARAATHAQGGSRIPPPPRPCDVGPYDYHAASDTPTSVSHA